MPLLNFKGQTKSSILYLADKHLPEAFHSAAQHQLHPKHLKKQARLDHHRADTGAAYLSVVFWTKCFGCYATAGPFCSSLKQPDYSLITSTPQLTGYGLFNDCSKL